MYSPDAINRYLVPVGCIWPSGGIYQSSSCRICSLPCFSAGGTHEDPSCLIMVVLKEIWLPFCFALLPPALINCVALHSCKRHCMFIVVALCAGSWSWSVTGNGLFLKLSCNISSSSISPILQGFRQGRIPAAGDWVMLQSRKDRGRITVTKMPNRLISKSCKSLQVYDKL